tara:strand:- start:12659 stop:12874 length:216 start_codon:yes stop_codon:yes gene_type:complete
MSKKDDKDMQGNAKENLQKYSEEVQKVQERKNQLIQELDALSKTEQRLVGAMVGLQELLGLEDEEHKKEEN